MNKKELIEYCESLKGDLNKFINGIDVNKIVKKIEQLDEPQKVTVPQFVADWIEYCKENHLTITGAFEPVSEHGIGLAETFKGSAYKCSRWALDNQNLFARAWLDGFEIEKEKRYIVKMTATKQPLFYNNMYEKIFFSLGDLATKFTCKELEKLGLGWVFDCPGVEVEEVEE